MTQQKSNVKKTYQALGVLLTYPSAQLVKALDGLSNILEQEALLSRDHLHAIRELTQSMQQTDLLELEERYVDLFDRKRKLSLYLFEHLYAESPDRGPAMIELAARYRQNRLELASTELPDYLPIFLEYLSTLPAEQATPLLAKYIAVITKLGERLKRNNALYHTVFDALVALTKSKESL